MDLCQMFGKIQAKRLVQNHSIHLRMISGKMSCEDLNLVEYIHDKSHIKMKRIFITGGLSSLNL